MTPTFHRWILHVIFLCLGGVAGWLFTVIALSPERLSTSQPSPFYVPPTSLVPRSANPLKALFAAKSPWQFPELKRTPDLTVAIESAIRDYHAVDANLKLHPANIYHDPEQRLVFLTFGIAEDSPVERTDFYLVYVYEPSSRRLLGHVHINMA
jgi:hypothetical protein